MRRLRCTACRIIKMLPKKGTAPPGYFEYKVSALEGLWTMPEGEDFDPNDKSRLIWTLIIAQPPFVTPELFEKCASPSGTEKAGRTDSVRFETWTRGFARRRFTSGLSIPSRKRLKAARVLEQEGYERIELAPRDLYVGFRKTAPEKLKRCCACASGETIVCAAGMALHTDEKVNRNREPAKRGFTSGSKACLRFKPSALCWYFNKHDKEDNELEQRRVDLKRLKPP